MHKFYRQEGDVNGLLMTFPGGNYGMDGPLLYYPSELLQAAGWDTLALTYSFQVEMKSISPDLFPDLMEECRTSVATTLAKRAYPRFGLVGKSLGAAVVAYLCQTEPSLVDARAAYLTPPLGTPIFDPIFSQTKQSAYLAVGSDDRFYDPQVLEALRATHLFKMTVIQGADHSMDVPGDLDASLEAVKWVVGEIVEFMKGD
jgi:predicted alpha/beta-fold hydrolase